MNYINVTSKPIKIDNKIINPSGIIITGELIKTTNYFKDGKYIIKYYFNILPGTLEKLAELEKIPNSTIIGSITASIMFPGRIKIEEEY